jgi:hypothetical protein
MDGAMKRYSRKQELESIERTTREILARKPRYEPITIDPAAIIAREQEIADLKAQLEYEQYIRVAASYLEENGELPGTRYVRQSIEYRQKAAQ